MRALAAVVFLGVLSASLPAFAETWRTKVALMEAASRSNCVDADVSRLFYDLTAGRRSRLQLPPMVRFAPLSPDRSVRIHTPSTLLET